MEQILSNTQQEDIGLVLLGNKCDMEPRNVTEEMGKRMDEELKVGYFETSALTGLGIKEAFEQLTRDIMKKKELEVELLLTKEKKKREKRW